MISQIDRKMKKFNRKMYYLKKNQMDILEFKIPYLKLRVH